jgi:hypothetical protein
MANEWDTAPEATADNAYQSGLLSTYELQENPNVWTFTMEERSGRAVGR